MGERRRIRPRRLASTSRALALAAAVVAAAGPLASGFLGCKGRREAEPAESGAPRPPAPAAPTAPVDRVLPGEIAAGPDEAFGLPIPRDMRVRARFPDAVFAEGPLSPEEVATYVRARVTSAHIEPGPAKTVLTGASVNDKDRREGAKRTLRIEVISRGSEASLVVRDETRPPAKEGLTEEERWKGLGLTKEGAPLDPTTLE